MFEWAIREGLMESNPVIRLSRKDFEAPIDKKQGFSAEEIQKIFYDGEFEKFKSKNPAYYWVPFIALYTGMRLEEISQLDCSDIYEDNEGIWVIDVREEDEKGNKTKKLKTVNSKRLIPIHKELLRLQQKLNDNIQTFYTNHARLQE